MQAASAERQTVHRQSVRGQALHRQTAEQTGHRSGRPVGEHLRHGGLGRGHARAERALPPAIASPAPGSALVTFSAGSVEVTVSSAEEASGTAGAAFAAPAPAAAKAAPRAATPRVLAADCFILNASLDT